MTLFGYSPAEIAKALTCLAGIATTLLAANLLPDGWSHWVSTVAGICTVVATYLVRNAPAAAAHGKHEAS